MRRVHILLVLVGVILLTLACSPIAGKPGTTVPANTAQSQDNSAKAPESPVQSQGKPLISGSGIGTIELLTDTKGVGTKPLFEWKAVSGVARYELIVYDDAGAPYWAWDGSQTKVHLGGGETQPPEDSAGPSLGAGYSWSVVAFDSNDKVVAASDTQSISP